VCVCVCLCVVGFCVCVCVCDFWGGVHFFPHLLIKEKTRAIVINK